MAQMLLTGKETGKGFMYGAGAGIVSYLLMLILKWIPAITVTFSSYATNLKESATVSSGIGDWLLNLINLPIPTTIIPALIAMAISGGAIFVIGQQVVKAVRVLPSGRTAFTKLFSVLLYGSLIGGLIINGFRMEGLLGVLVILSINALVLAFVLNSKIVTKNLKLKAPM